MTTNTPEQNKRYRKAYYARNKEQIKSEVKARKNKNKEWLREYKAGLVCSICGFDHPAALQFHHRDPSTKDMDVSAAIGWSIDRLLKEIEKCDVLCANCHAILHASLV